MSSIKQFILSFLICLAAFSFIAFGLSNVLDFSGSTQEQPPAVSGTDDDSSQGSSVIPESKGESVSALIIGLDPVDPKTPEIDALVVVKADISAKKLYVCSIPTDTKYEVSGSYSSGGEQKDYSYFMSFKETVVNRGSSNYTKGLEYLTGKVSAITGVNFDYYFALNTSQAATVFNKFTDGGLENYIVPEQMRYDYDPKYNAETGETENDYSGSLDINLYEGKHEKFTGAKAMGYVRYRDYTSGDRQSSQLGLIETFVKSVLTENNSFKNELISNENPLALFGIGKKDTNADTADVIEHLDTIFSLSEYEFVSIPFNYNDMIKNDRVPTLHDYFN